MTDQVELIVDAKNAVGESPVWDAGRQQLWWVDISGRRLWCWSAASGAARCWETPQMCGCIAATSNDSGAPWGTWVAAMESDIAFIQPQDDGSISISSLATVHHAESGMRFNDGRCDRQGRLRAGTMVMDMGKASRSGNIYALSEDLPPRPLLTGFITPNGMAFSPDGTTMYLSDSHPEVQTVWAYQYDIESGTPHDPKVFVDMKNLPGRPDGAAIDVDGCYWICGNDAGLIHRFTPDGHLDRSIAVPVKKPAMCAFGGSGLDTLFVTSIRPTNIDLSDQPLAGGLFALRPGVSGIAEPFFSTMKLPGDLP